MKNNKPRTTDRLHDALGTFANLPYFDYCENAVAQSIFQELRALNVLVLDVREHILDKTEQLEELRQSHDREKRSSGVILHYYSDSQRVFRTPGAKRGTYAESREAKKRKLQNS